MIARHIIVILCWLAVSVHASVRVFVEEDGGLGWIKYECTAGEVVRAFALDIAVDRGTILEVSDFFVGESTVAAQGYGIFPSAFRDHVVLSPGGVADWGHQDYTPVANAGGTALDTLPGLGSSGVTVEFGGLWDATEPDALPPSTGTLCSVRVSQGAEVRISGNGSRGGVVAANPNLLLVPVFESAFVQPPRITDIFETRGIIVITFEGGELEQASQLDGPWTGTGSSNGVYAEFVNRSSKKFFRVNSL